MLIEQFDLSSSPHINLTSLFKLFLLRTHALQALRQGYTNIRAIKQKNIFFYCPKVRYTLYNGTSRNELWPILILKHFKIRIFLGMFENAKNDNQGWRLARLCKFNDEKYYVKVSKQRKLYFFGRRKPLKF